MFRLILVSFSLESETITLSHTWQAFKQMKLARLFDVVSQLLFSVSRTNLITT